MNISPDLKVGRRIGSPSTRSVALQSVHIHNHNIVGAAASLPTFPHHDVEQIQVAESSEPAVLASSVATANTDVLATPVDVEPKRFAVQNYACADFIVSVGFLKHIIAVLVRNHSITTDAKDLNDILSYFGEVDMRVSAVQHRSVKNKGWCSNVDIDDIVEVVQKVLVNGVNIIKRVPDFVEYLQQLGIAI